MNLLKYRNIILFSLSGFILLLSIFIKIGGNGRLDLEISQLKVRIENTRLFAGDEERFNRNYEGIKRKTELANKKVPKEAQIPHAIEELTSAIAYLNIKILSITPREYVEVRRKKEELLPGPVPEGEFFPERLSREADKPDYIRIPIEINMQGSYADIGKYLDNLRNLSRLFVLEGCNIEKTDEAGILNIQLVVSIYYSP